MANQVGYKLEVLVQNKFLTSTIFILSEPDDMNLRVIGLGDLASWGVGMQE